MKSFVFTPEGHENERKVSVVAVTLTLFLLSCPVCRYAEQGERLRVALAFPPELHFSLVHYSSPATVAVVVDSLLTKTPCPSPYQETLCTAYKVTFMLCSMLKWSVHHADLQFMWTAQAKGSFGTQRKLEENSDDESPRQLEEGTKLLE